MEQLIVEAPYMGEDEDAKPSPQAALVSYVMGHVERWRATRDSAYKAKWDAYYNTWRGNWTPDSKSRKSERSKLISPATQMAVDLTVAEIVEALFSREQFFDVPDNIADEEKQDITRARDQLLEDLYKDGIVGTMTEIVLNGALYGTGIAKINIDVEMKAQARIVTTDKDGNKTAPHMVKEQREVVRIYPVAIEPGQLVPDTAASKIDDMLGVVHEFRMPLHRISARQASKTYYDVQVGPSADAEQGTDQRHEGDVDPLNDTAADVVEWHGLVPARLLAAVNMKDDDNPLTQAMIDSTDDEEMAEAVVTIANKGVLLRAIANPSVMEDRAIVAYQHDNVPNRFWGRGVVEKGWNPQKALDGEMRSRADALAWINNPMIAGDITRLPPRMNLNVWPGKFWGTRGDPRESIQEFRFGDVNASTFQQTAELERMVQDATGARDPGTLRSNVRDESAAGAGIAVSGIVKRSKRTMYNIEEFMTTLVRRIMWRKMQFEPDRFPVDVDFRVKGTAGIMARELEQQFMVNLLQFTEQGTPPYLVILKAIFDQSASPRKGELMKAIETMMQPPSEEEKAKAQQMEQLQIQGAVEEIRNTRADTALKLAQGDKNKAETLLKQIEADFKDDEMMLESIRLQIDVKETENSAEQNEISRDKNEIQRQALRQKKTETK